MKMRVAVIGAGIAGLYSTKACLEEHLEPVCYERNSYVGGMWKYHDDPGELDTARVYEGLTLNSSRESHIISDFPDLPGERDDPPTAEQHLNYILRYARYNKLIQHIKLNHEVLSIEPSKNHSIDEQWIVKVKHRGTVSTETFDAVMICPGRYRTPIKPKIKGFDDYEGDVYAANRYRHNRQDEVMEKEILVIGNAFSAADIAVMMAKTAKQVYLSIGRGCTVIGETYNDPEPVGMESVFMRRNLMHDPNATAILNDRLIRFTDQFFPDRERYGVTPGGYPLSRPVCIQDKLPDMIRTGRIRIKPAITEMMKNEVFFEDGTSIAPDTVFCATGYEVSFPFLSEDIVADKSKDLELYEGVFPLSTEHHNLAFVGSTVHGFILSTILIEIQARWTVQVLKGNAKLPSEDVMRREIRDRAAKVIEIFGENRGQLDVPFLVYTDRLAEKIGCLPSLWRMVFTDPLLAYAYWYGVSYSCHYRLVGPHAWPEARKTALQLFQSWRKQKGDAWNWRRIGAVAGLSLLATVLAAAAWNAGPYPGYS